MICNDFHIPSMKHNLIPPFLIEEADLVVNDMPRTHCGNNLNENSPCIIVDEPVFAFIYHLMASSLISLSRHLLDEEIECPDHFTSIYLIRDASQWDPHNEAYSAAESSFLNPLTGELLYPQIKQQKLSYMMTSILRSLIFSAKQPYQMMLLIGMVFCTAIFCESNPQGGDYDFNRQDKFMKNDLSVFVNNDLFKLALNKRVK